jgi:hypothetical protein
VATKALKSVGGTVEDALNEIDRTRNIAQRIAAVMGEVDYVQKEKKQGMNYSIVSHDAVTAKVRPLLHKHGVIYYPTGFNGTQNGNRTELMFVVRFENVDNRADYIDVSTMGFGVDAQDKGPGKAISYGVKYALLKVLGLETGDDPDTVQDTRANFQPAPHAEPKLPEDAGRGDGEMSSSALRASLRLLVHHINGCASVADLEDVLDTEDAKEVIDNCKRRFPAWWETGENMPAEFVPLKKLIDQTRRGLKELETAA